MFNEWQKDLKLALIKLYKNSKKELHATYSYPREL